MTRKKKPTHVHSHHGPNYIVNKLQLVESTDVEPIGTEG